MTVPLSYRGIANDIAERIAIGEYPAGSKIPSYRQLSELYSVSISTAQRAVMALEERGVVIGVPGRGVFVRESH
jgi:DNA-binding GntR family transcriptional regulator